ncbi:M56 family metallopeptidase [bacterium]|nr:M56 family metallopeptidase [bacterium]
MTLFEIVNTFNRLGFLIFRYLVSFFWQSTLFFGAVLLVFILFRRLSSSIKQRILFVSLCAIPLIPLVSKTVIDIGVPYIRIPVIPTYFPQSVVFDRIIQPTVTENPLVIGESTRQINPVYKNTTLSKSNSLTYGRIILSHPWMFVLLIYMAVLILFLKRITAKWVALRALADSSTYDLDPETNHIVQEASSKIKCNQSFRVVENEDIVSPMVFGIIKPVIVIPKSEKWNFSRSDMYLMFLHEITHIKRKDQLVFLIVSIIRAFFFFHPVIWIVAWQLLLLAEKSCDDSVLDIQENPISYASLLIKIMENARNQSFSLNVAANLGFPKSMFYKRIISLLLEHKHHQRKYSIFAITAFFALLISSYIVTAAIPLSESLKTLINSNNLMSRFLISENIGVRNQIQYNATAYAVPLYGITIDGRLEDWPPNMTRYPILNYGKTYGPTDIDYEDLSKSSDLSPHFMVGYNPDKNLLYLAVIVRDDIMFSFSEHATLSLFDYPDACEIYLSGKKKNSIISMNETLTANELPVLQYVMTASGIIYNKNVPNTDISRNPILVMGDITKTKTHAVSSRTGDVTVYEWELEVFDKYPDNKTQLIPGKTIGFDVAVVDRDHEDEFSAWGCWGPSGYLKVANTYLIGDIVLLRDNNNFGSVTGTVVNSQTGQGIFKQIIDVYRQGKPITWTMSDSDGKFGMQLPEGQYVLKPRYHDKGHEIALTVKSGESTTTDVMLDITKIPEKLLETIKLYSNLSSYSDVTEVNAVMGIQNTKIEFAFKNPNFMYQSYTRIENGDKCIISCDGSKMRVNRENSEEFLEKKAPGELSVFTISSLTNQPSGGFVHQLMLCREPLKQLNEDLISVRYLSSDRIDGVESDIFEINMRAGTFTTSTRWTPDYTIVYRLWIGKRDKVIRKVVTEMEERLDIAKASEDNMVTKVRHYSVTHRHRKIKLNPKLMDTLFKDNHNRVAI